jgi:Z1 domain
MDNPLTMLERTVTASLMGDTIARDEATIAARVDALASILTPDLSQDEKKQLIRNLHARFDISMDLGASISGKDEHKAWLAARKSTVDFFFWNRYREYLSQERFPPAVLSRMDSNTDEILDLCGNPENHQTWRRRGLVIGDVQSGKTANYTALICKAADAGYRLIILLTGTLENLRQQTQERLDHGFVGLDSAGLINRNRENRIVGAGRLNAQRTAAVFTSRIDDFRASTVNALNLRVASVKDPILLVVKKNKRVLENLTGWLRTYNANTRGVIDDTPALVIDDEADNASINTGSDESPTAINEQIRALLKLFSQNSFVGFTATPFANIFVNPETESDMLGDDLFPRDFIFALEAPSNYTGAEQIFGDDPSKDTEHAIVPIVDAERSIPQSHKSNFRPSLLPDSLLEAIDTFLLCNAVRDLTEKRTSHRSMLINVSRFTAVQNHIRDLVDIHVRETQSAARNYASLPVERAMRESAVLLRLRHVWDKVYGKHLSDADWTDVLKLLHESIAPVIVRSINQSTQDRLDYSANGETGLRVIAVGGNSLSRGLTLEGLCVSYFLRNTRMYDTLLQMGRWFGYRAGYGHLCRIWLTDEAIHWYRHIAEAAGELRSEIRRMKRVGGTPNDFGLKVRAHPDALLVTARNKMRSASDFERVVSFSGEAIETAELPRDDESLQMNLAVTERLIRELDERWAAARRSRGQHLLWSGISRETVVHFLRSFRPHGKDMNFYGDALEDYLASCEVPALMDWDIAVPQRQAGESFVLGNLLMIPRTRKVDVNPESILVSGSKRRVGEASDESIGLDDETLEKVRRDYAIENPDKSVPGKAYRRVRTRPLLLIHLIQPVSETEVSGGSSQTPPVALPMLAAVGLSFPMFDDGTEHTRVKYKINLVEYRRLFGEDEIGNSEIDD